MNKVIVLDPGHGGNATVGGSLPNKAVSSTGVLEKTMTLEFARIIRNALLARSKEITVVLTRETDINLRLAARAEVAAAKQADLFLSIHLNARHPNFSGETIRGVETWVRGIRRGNLNFSADSAFARRIQQAMVTALRAHDSATPDGGVKSDDDRPLSLGVLSPTSLGNTASGSHFCRACLAQVEYIDNPVVDELLNTGSNVNGVRSDIAALLAEALLDELAVPFSPPVAVATPVEPPAPPPDTTSDAFKSAVGIRNKNYLNLKQPLPQHWLDAGNKDSGIDSNGHAVFTDAAYGVRAGILQLRAYFFNKGKPRRTIAEILGRWAPADDTEGSLVGMPPNSPVEYSLFVSRRMGIGPNQNLELFHEDKSLGNVAQLRDLFCAMAAFEIGADFRVPPKDFEAGLELLQAGVLSTGTDSHATNAALTGVPSELADALAKWQISGSVGRVDKGAANATADVETVQQMLRNVAMLLDNRAIDPGGIDGNIVVGAKESATVKALEAFQTRFMLQPDGLIDVGGRTWKELLVVLSGGKEITLAAATQDFCFPFASLPKQDWTNEPRSFGARRDHGARAHAGCDLYFDADTIIYSVTAGVVIRGPYPFYAGTFALEIDHGTFVARYGEVQKETFVKTGDKVVTGQRIAKVGHLVGISVSSDMLHFELYDKSATGPLTVGAAQSARTASGMPFMRRRDLIDPTSTLNDWQRTLAGTPNPAQAVTVAKAATTGTGFSIVLKRQRQEKRVEIPFSRTVGQYECFWNGAAIDGLKGQIVERGGPGDNSTEIGDNGNRRIREGTYPLAIQDGSHYKTDGYNRIDVTSSGSPKPGILLKDTDERFAILLHPGHDYVSSVGCLNLASGLTDANSGIDFSDSRARVIAIIDALKAKLGNTFPRTGTIPHALIRIEGEPSPASSQRPLKEDAEKPQPRPNAVRVFTACKHEVLDRGSPPAAFLNELVDWGLEAPDEIFAPSDRHDIYTNVSDRLGPWEGILHRKAVMLEVLRVLGGFESSWKWQEGRDTNNRTSNTVETEEAGLFQISANAMNFDPSLKALLGRYAEGQSDPKTFNVTTKHNHAFAIEFAARLLRFTVEHNGPVKKRKINPFLRRDAVEELRGFLAQSSATSPQPTA